MKTTIKRITLLVLALLFAAFSMSGALASHYSYYDDRDCAGCGYPYEGYAPIYRTGYYASSWTYGYSGWDYNRVYYRYHYPYSTWRYNSYYPPGTWVAHYAYRSYPMYVGYPYPGYYW
jgi:hypothetical protein